MSSVVISGDTSGTITLAAPAVAGSTTLTLPTIAGTVGVLVSGTVNAGGANPFNNTLSSIDFTGIPANVRRITVMFSGVSTSGSSNYLIQLGAGSVTSSGYISYGMSFGSSSGAGTSSTAGFLIRNSAAGDINSGLYTIATLGSNAWAMQGMIGSSNNSNGYLTCGGLTLGGTLDRVRITTVNGTDTFDAGSINILYE
jgi:hypothetical protein